jgi:hypothetical protein
MEYVNDRPTHVCTCARACVCIKESAINKNQSQFKTENRNEHIWAICVGSNGKARGQQTTWKIKA